MSVAMTDLITPATRAEMLEFLLAIAAANDLPTTSWQSGGNMLTFLTTVAEEMSVMTQTNVAIAKGGFGDLLPSDQWADLWAQSRFDVQRVAATQASGLMNFTNSTITNYSRNPGEIIVAHEVTGKTYRNREAVTILGTTGLDDVIMDADEPGTDSNAAPDSITVMVSSLVGVGCTNPLAFIGTDKETTPRLVTRARSKLGALSPNGPKDAYNYIATTPTESVGLSTPVTRTRTVVSLTTGDITVYLATNAGAPSGPDIAIVQAAIDAKAEPWGANATAVAAAEESIDVTYQVWVQGAQLTAAQIQSAIETALSEWLATLDPGGYVIPPDTGAIYVGSLEQVIGNAVDGILRVEVTVPAADVVLTPDQVAILGTVTPTVTLL